MKRFVCLATTVLLLGGCSDRSENQLTEAPATPVAASLKLVPIAEVGCSSCGGLEQLLIRSVTTDGQQRLYVLDRFEPFVRVFDFEGGLVAAFGRFGDGPGELRRPGSLYAKEDGGVYVLDRVARRLLLYASDGTPRDEWQLPHYPYSPVYEPRSDRLFFAATHEATVRGESGVYVFDPKEDTVHRATSFAGDFPAGPEGGPSIHYPIAVDARGNLAIGENTERYRTRIFGPAGELIRQHELGIDRVTKTAAELDLERRRSAGESIRIVPDERKHHYYADALAFDANGRLWVRAGRSDAETTIFDVFDSDGYLGTVTAPGGITERDRYVIRGPYLVASYLDEADEYMVRVFRIEEGG